MKKSVTFLALFFLFPINGQSSHFVEREIGEERVVAMPKTSQVSYEDAEFYQGEDGRFYQKNVNQSRNSERAEPTPEVSSEANFIEKIFHYLFS